MKYLYKSFLAAMLMAMCLPLQADIREAFICTYKDGKGIDDMRAARDHYVEVGKKNNLDLPNAFMWTPWKSYGNADVLWFNVHEDFAEFARRSDAGAGNEAMGDAISKFVETADCVSGLFNRQVLFDGGKFNIENPPAVIQSNACNLREGARRSDLESLWDHARDVLGSLKEYENHIAFVSTPITSGPNSPDLFMYGVHDSATAMATKGAAFFGSEGYPMLSEHFNAVLDCTNSYWVGRPAVTND